VKEPVAVLAEMLFALLALGCGLIFATFVTDYAEVVFGGFGYGGLGREVD